VRKQKDKPVAECLLLIHASNIQNSGHYFNTREWHGHELAASLASFVVPKIRFDLSLPLTSLLTPFHSMPLDRLIHQYGRKPADKPTTPLAVVHRNHGRGLNGSNLLVISYIEKGIMISRLEDRADAVLAISWCVHCEPDMDRCAMG
jgi:hypothetical protein